MRLLDSIENALLQKLRQHVSVDVARSVIHADTARQLCQKHNLHCMWRNDSRVFEFSRQAFSAPSDMNSMIIA